METKQQIRGRVIAERRALPADERARRSDIIVDTLLGLAAVESARSIFSFLPFNGEVDIDRFIRSCVEDGKSVYAPKTWIQEKRMHPVLFPGWEGLVAGSYGIREPDPALSQVWRGEPFDVMIVPGVAFTRNGERLGYGGGYYDRFFEGIKTLPDLIAPCFELQILDDIPVERHDIQVDYLVTENSVHKCSKFRHRI